MSETIEKPQASPKKPAPAFRVIHGLVKSLAIVLGLPLTVLSLMSLIGLATDNIWIRLVPALVVALGAPLLLIDRLLPDDTAQAKGLPTDVLALVWLGFGVIFVGLAQPATGSVLISEGDHFASSGQTALARVTYWVAGATPVSPRPRPSDAGAGDASAGDAAASADGGPDGAVAPGQDASAADAQRAAETAATTGDADGAHRDEAPSPAKADGGAKLPTLSPTELFRKISPAIVTISARDSSGDESSGTGFFIDADGTIATNHHVIDRAASVGVKLIGSQYSGGHRWLHEVELLADDAENDLALLRVPPQADIEPLLLGDSETVAVGERVICIGNPLGLEHTLSDGLVSARRLHDGRRWIQMTAPISPGNSGGPVIVLNGEVVGIATATVNRLFQEAQNLNLAIPVNTLKALIHDDYPERRQFKVGPGGSSTW